MKKILVTGGAGFIGSALIRDLIRSTEFEVINIDALTYAGNLGSLLSVIEGGRYFFEKVDICDSDSVKRVFHMHKPDAIIHLAAESHVDRSIRGPEEFIRTNILGTFTLLNAALEYWTKALGESPDFRFHHVSTDEVFGDLGSTGGYFSETTPYAPSSPYSASKASSDHLVMAWSRTYGLPVVLTNCSNNYGPFQFPEKLIPVTIINAMLGKQIPVYGDGKQIRDWLFVHDHSSALLRVLSSGVVGEAYNIGGSSELANIDVVRKICSLLDNMTEAPPNGLASHSDLVTHVDDRPGHDVRYAIDASKIHRELGWRPSETFDTGLKKTVQWYLDHKQWWSSVLDGSYRNQQY